MKAPVFYSLQFKSFTTGWTQSIHQPDNFTLLGYREAAANLQKRFGFRYRVVKMTGVR